MNLQETALHMKAERGHGWLQVKDCSNMRLLLSVREMLRLDVNESLLLYIRVTSILVGWTYNIFF